MAEPTEPNATEPPVTKTPPVPPTAPVEPDANRSVGELVFDVSERVSILVREEIELAKAEITEKLATLGRGAGIAAAAGVFLLAAGIMLMFAIAWLINDILGIEGSVWVGFAIEAGILVILAAVAGLIAKSLFGKVESPTPDMAIEELKETKETLGKAP
ncbi:MAG TPA: phage holin family protein [Solirubrobacterales bacterium]|jgi:putative superfamily III holin-X|nr:phage holin family protein [Solirubrobacterales bacterium]